MTSPRNNHPLPTAVHFYKIIPRTSLEHGILKLPAGKYGDGMSNPVFLKPADGTEWKTYWTKHDGEIWFQKGWKEFATYYSLDHGHLLLFESQGTSHFDVNIFYKSAIEVDYPSHGFLDEKDNLVEISDYSIGIVDDQLLCQKTRVTPTLSSPQPSKKMKTGLTKNVERSSNVVNLHQHVQTRSTRSQKAKFVKHELDEDEDKGIFITECPKVEQLTSTTLNEATAFRSEHPSFRLVIKPSFINGDYLELPPQFAEQYLKKTHEVVILEVLDGRTWPVICSAPRITGGWEKFASENNLNVGDVCVFELIHKIQGLAFKVSIFRGESPIQRSSQLESDIKSKILTTKALEEASKFSSEYPFFKVTLTRDKGNNRNIARRPRVPVNFVRKYFVNMNQKVMKIQFRKKLWPVTFLFNEYNTSGMLSAGWPSFARENKLQPRDVCIFELINGENATLDVHVFRGHSKVMQ